MTGRSQISGVVILNLHDRYSISVKIKRGKINDFRVFELCSFLSYDNNNLEQTNAYIILYYLERKHLDAATIGTTAYSSKNVIFLKLYNPKR